MPAQFDGWTESLIPSSYLVEPIAYYRYTRIRVRNVCIICSKYSVETAAMGNIVPVVVSRRVLVVNLPKPHFAWPTRGFGSVSGSIK